MPELISFFDRHDPALPVGTYELTVEQAITGPSAAAIDEHPTTTKRFAVSGPRFALPASLIAAQFPPPDTVGDYGDALAHVALTRLTLPWERSADGGAQPWLAALVFDEGDPVVVADAQVGDLQRKVFAPDPAQPLEMRDSTLASTALSYGDADHDWILEPGQSLGDPCRVIDVDAALFAKLAPPAGDLAWLAHTRSQPATGGAMSLAYVTANRTPTPGGASIAHLVSLEHLATFLPDKDGTPSAALAGATAVRLVSLASWSFHTHAAAETFTARLQAVPCDVFSLPEPGTKAPDGDDTADAAVGLGYCALEHRTRAGDSTISWYRGPFAPCAVKDGIVPRPDPDATEAAEPISTADALLRYDPQTAMFDISYAAAWQLGRLLAMADDHFSSRLRAWKATVSRGTALALERDLIDDRLGAVLDLGPQADDDAGSAHPAPALAAAATALVTRLQAALRSGASGGRAVAPAPAPPGPGLHERLTQAVADPQSLAAADAELPASVQAWLAGLARLEGVPLRYLVPDERLLPSPSLRFFQLDANWTRALVEGAFSIARTSSAQAAHDAAVAPAVHDAAAPPASGLLLRSTIVDDWPDLVFTARDTSGGEHGAIVRRIAPGTVLVLFDGTAQEVTIHEAPSALHLAVPGAGAARPGRSAGVVDVGGLAGTLGAKNSAELARQLAAEGEGVSYQIGAP